MRKHSLLAAIVVLSLSSSGCAATHTRASARPRVPAAASATHLLVENHTNADVYIYVVPADTRIRHRLGEVRSNRRGTFLLPSVGLGKMGEVYLVAVPVGPLDPLGIPTGNRLLVHPEPLRLRSSQHIVWQLTGISTPQVSAVRVF